MKQVLLQGGDVSIIVGIVDKATISQPDVRAAIALSQSADELRVGVGKQVGAEISAALCLNRLSDQGIRKRGFRECEDVGCRPAV